MADNPIEMFTSGQELLSKEHPARKVGDPLLEGAGQMIAKESAINTQARAKLPTSLGIMKEAGYGAMLYPVVLLAGEIGTKLLPIPLVGGLVGRAVGAEAAGLVYDQIIRRFDKNLPPLEGKDYIYGALIGDPMLASTFRQTINEFQTLSNPDNLMRAQIPTTFK